MERKQVLGLVGAGLLALGVFAPIITFLGFISISLSNISTVDLIILWALAVISGLLVYRKMYKPLWATGLLSLGWVVFRFIYIQTNMNSALGGASSENAADAPGMELAGNLVSMGWGWVVLVAGAALIIAAAAIKEPEKLTMSAGPQ